MKTIIFQVSPYRPASTFLVNALYGLIPELADKKIIGHWNPNFLYIHNNNNIIVVKSHQLDIDKTINEYEKDYNLFFICSERAGLNRFIDDKYKTYKNVVVFEFNELNETETNTIPIIITNIYNKINKMLNIELNIEGGINRIKNMNKCYELIKNEPHSYIDKFFEIHGHHRNRND